MRGLVEKVEVELRAPSRLKAAAVALGLLGLIGFSGFALQQRIESGRKAAPTPTGGPGADLGVRVVQYAQTAKRPLFLHLFEPEGAPTGAIIFFHGGGLVQTPIAQFKRQAADLAASGMLSVIAEYRVAWDDASFPEAAIDASAALDWVRDHASELRLDPAKIAVAGAAVGGWMAASTQSLPTESRANAIVLLDPLLGGALTAIADDAIPSPTLILVAEKDQATPVESSRRYCAESAGCEFVVWPASDQGFFNKDESYDDVLLRIKEFLVTVGLL